MLRPVPTALAVGPTKFLWGFRLERRLRHSGTDGTQLDILTPLEHSIWRRPGVDPFELHGSIVSPPSIAYQADPRDRRWNEGEFFDEGWALSFLTTCPALIHPSPRHRRLHVT